MQELISSIDYSTYLLLSSLPLFNVLIVRSGLNLIEFAEYVWERHGEKDVKLW